MKNISGKDMDELYFNLCNEIHVNPQFETKPRDMKIKESMYGLMLLLVIYQLVRNGQKK